MDKEIKLELAQVDRREFLRLVAMFGATATLGGVLGAPPFADAQELRDRVIAQAAKEEKKKASAEHVLLFGTGGRLNRWPGEPVVHCSPELIGFAKFKEYVERESKGAIFIDVIEGGSLGVQTILAKKAQQGVIQGCTCSTQNVAGLIPIWNVTDFPYTIGEENYWKLLYSKEINDAIRVKSMEGGLVCLYVFAPDRWFGIRKGIPEVRLPEHLKGLKIRVTGSKLEQEILKMLPCNPTPIAWGETYTAIHDGAIDGLHTNVAAQSDFGFQEVVGQIINTGIMPSADASWLSTSFYRKLSPKLQEVTMEAAYEATVFSDDIFDVFHSKQIGIKPDSPPNSIWKKANVKQVHLTPSEKEAWKNWVAYDRHKDRFDPLAETFGKQAFETVLRVARAPGPIEKRRWWKT